jgi:cytidylate kinase
MKIKKSRSIQQIIDEQVTKWRAVGGAEKVEEGPFSTITFSREPGSSGHIVAKRIADELQYDFFDQEIIQAVAESSQVRATVIETLDEKGISSLDDMISAVEDERHIWSYEYLHHLMKVIGTIGRHGNAVILGRGANFILPGKGVFRVRVVAPIDVKIQNVSSEMNISVGEARAFIIRTESDRKAFVRKYFNADIENPEHYDLILNTARMTVDTAVACVKTALGA